MTTLAEMTFQTGAIVVISVLGTVVAALFKIQQKSQGDRLTIVEKRSDECEEDRSKLRDEIGDLKQRIGLADGTIKHFERCGIEGCPMRAIAATYSLKQAQAKQS